MHACLCVCVVLGSGTAAPPKRQQQHLDSQAMARADSVSLRERPDDAKGYGRDLEGHFHLLVHVVLLVAGLPASKYAVFRA